MTIDKNVTTLYVLHDMSGAVIYVGIATTPWLRLHQHAKDKPWWQQVASAKFTHFPDRINAEKAEQTLICALRPPYNTAWVPAEPVPHPNTIDPMRRVEYVPADVAPEDRISLDDMDMGPVSLD